MLKYFICPDGDRIEVEKCHKECRMECGRCAPRNYLLAIAEEREWRGKPSVTQCIKGTRQAYLELTHDFALDPQDAFFRMAGTGFHSKLESQGDAETCEVRVEDEDCYGTLDLIEDDTLWDHKMTGSYKGMLVLGLQKFDGPLMFDEAGQPVLYKRGPKKGQQKREVIWKRSGTPDIKEWQLQTCKYRQMYVQQEQKPLIHIKIFMGIRDSGLEIAQNRGIDKSFYVVDIPLLPDDEVKKYFRTKKELLLLAMDTKTIPELCTPEECWNGRRCQGYCSVSEHCKDNPYLTTKFEEEE